MDSDYTLENARQFGWSSISGDLNPERVAHLRTYLVGQKILDAGCGGGGYVDFLTRQGLDVTGVDKFSQFLDVAQQQERKGRFVQGDLTALDFVDKSFDCTYCFDVLEHIDDVAAIKEMARVTKRRLILAIPKGEDEFLIPYGLIFAHNRDKTHLRTYTEASLRATIDAVSPAKVDIFPEFAVNTEGLVAELLQLNYQDQGAKRQSRVARLYRDQTAEHIMETATYRELYMGLVAVVDLV